MRIVSLLPAATDIVAELGLADHLVGRTHECDWPPEDVRSVPVVTSTALRPDQMSSREISQVVGAGHQGSALYALDAALMADLAPDVVLTQDLCEKCAVSYRQVTRALRVMDAGPRVVSLEPSTLPEVIACLVEVGRILGVADRAKERARELERRLGVVAAAVDGRPQPRTAAIEWLDPLWPAGHWVPEQIAAAGGSALLAEPGEHTTAMSWDVLRDAQPDTLLLLPCGFAPDRTLAEWRLLTRNEGWHDLPAVQADQIWVLDGPSYFNRPGPRVVRGVEILAHVLHGVEAGAPVSPAEARRVAQVPENTEASP